LWKELEKTKGSAWEYFKAVYEQDAKQTTSWRKTCSAKNAMTQIATFTEPGENKS